MNIIGSDGQDAEGPTEDPTGGWKYMYTLKWQLNGNKMKTYTRRYQRRRVSEAEGPKGKSPYSTSECKALQSNNGR